MDRYKITKLGSGAPLDGEWRIKQDLTDWRGYFVMEKIEDHEWPETISAYPKELERVGAEVVL